MLRRNFFYCRRKLFPRCDGMRRWCLIRKLERLCCLEGCRVPDWQGRRQLYWGTRGSISLVLALIRLTQESSTFIAKTWRTQCGSHPVAKGATRMGQPATTTRRAISKTREVAHP